MDKKEMSKTIGIWACVNKNGFLNMHNEQPSRNESTGKWQSSKPYCNSLLQTQLENLFSKSNVTWESDPEYFEIAM